MTCAGLARRTRGSKVRGSIALTRPTLPQFRLSRAGTQCESGLFSWRVIVPN